MRVFAGKSCSKDGKEAVAEATATWSCVEPLDMILAFTSTERDPAEVARALADTFPGVRMAGCTTAGEHIGGQHYRGALVVAGIVSPKVRWSTTLVEDIASFDQATADRATRGLFEHLGIDSESFDPRELVCLTFIDGLS